MNNLIIIITSINTNIQQFHSDCFKRFLKIGFSYFIHPIMIIIINMILFWLKNMNLFQSNLSLLLFYDYQFHYFIIYHNIYSSLIILTFYSFVFDQL